MDAYSFAGISVALVTAILILGDFIFVVFIYKYLKVG